MEEMTANEKAVIFSDVTKTYKLYKNDRARFRSLFSKKVPFKVNNAVNHVSFEIDRGESVALFGRNGAGKSTILKMITGVAFPTEGEITVNGQVSALLELSAGFDVESTGRENIYLKCSLMGIPDPEIAKLEDAIIEFADIGDYIDQPLRSYSSGMRARLGFAINSNVNPDILIIDEALSVGDRNFRKKCKEKVAEIMADDGVTLLFVTHSAETAMDFCKRGIVLDKGKLMFDGGVEEAAAFYNEMDAQALRKKKIRSVLP